MNKRLALIIGIIILLIVAVFIWGEIGIPYLGLTKTFTIAKAWWPVWDTFQLGVQIREENTKESFGTIFLQSEEYTSALSDFQNDIADAVTLTIYEAIEAASEGKLLKIVLVLDYTIGSDGVVAKKSIRSLEDLRGKKVGVEKGTIAHFTLLKALEKAGLDKTEVQLVDLSLDALQQAFLNGEIVAAGTYDPYLSSMAKQGNGYVIFSSREIPRAIVDVLFVKESLARDNPEVIDHWIMAWNDALNFKGRETIKYLSTLNQLNGTPISDLKDSFDGIFFTDLAENRRAFGTKADPGYLLTSLQEMASFMLKQGIIKRSVSLENLIDYDSIQRFFKN